MQTSQQMSPADQMAKLQQQNMQARQLVLKQAYPMVQSIFSTQIQPNTQPNLQVPPQNVGLIRGFLVKLSATITNPAAGSSQLNITPFGLGNLIQNFIFTDLQNYQRINVPGWYLSTLNSLRQGRPFYSSTPSDSPNGYGSNWTIIKAPATIATNSSANIQMYFWVPLAYSEHDLTGAIYANVVNATMNMQFQFATNAQAFVANTADPTLAIYQGSGAVAGVTLTNLNVQIYQDYLDQLPMGQKGAILPSVDLNTMYELKATAFTALVANQDFYIQYSNFRHFLSTMVIFDNQTGGAYPTPGSDVNYLSIRSANATDLRKTDPYTWAAQTRKLIQTDVPVPMYVTDTRKKPIYTTQTGNVALVVNSSTVNANSSMLVGWEMLANVSNLMNAASLSAS